MTTSSLAIVSPILGSTVSFWVYWSSIAPPRIEFSILFFLKCIIEASLW